MINIRLPRSEFEFQEACKLVAIMYQHRNYADYLKPEDNRPDILFVAEDDTRIIGSVGMMIHSAFPIEWFFDLNISDVLGKGRESIFEICKLACGGKNATLAFKGLICAIYKYANMHNLDQSVACMKPALAKRLREIGILYDEITGAKVISRRVPNIYKGYFLDNPRPIALSIPVEGNLPTVEEFENELEGLVSIRVKDSAEIDFGMWYENLAIHP